MLYRNRKDMIATIIQTLFDNVYEISYNADNNDSISNEHIITDLLNQKFNLYLIHLDITENMIIIYFNINEKKIISHNLDIDDIILFQKFDINYTELIYHLKHVVRQNKFIEMNEILKMLGE